MKNYEAAIKATKNLQPIVKKGRRSKRDIGVKVLLLVLLLFVYIVKIIMYLPCSENIELFFF